MATRKQIDRPADLGPGYPSSGMSHVGRGVMDRGYDGHSQRRMNFEDCIPNGVTMQTVNGTARDVGTGWNRQKGPTKKEQVAASGAWQGGRTNRTGE